MTGRTNLMADFLAAHGIDPATATVLADDASFRRYFRARTDDGPVVVMDAPPDHEDVRPFVKVARHLVALGFSAPQVLAEDAAGGFLLLEDLGDDTFTRILEPGGSERELYEAATDVLIALHSLPAKAALPPGTPPYGNGRLMDEAFLLPQWFVPAFTGAHMGEDARRAYGEAWLSVFPAVHALPKTLTLRDYHVDNLIWLPDRGGIARVGLLDFQDAVAGPGAYDLMSLLEDARRDIAPELKDAMMTRYLDAFPDLDPDAFADAFAVLAAQRHAKVIGIFTRLCLRDGKDTYLPHIPRVWRLLEAALARPVLAPVRAWFDDHVPAEMRVVPPVDGAAP